MKKFLYPLLCLSFLAPHTLFGQIHLTAGQFPFGSPPYDPMISLTDSMTGATESGFFDIDCDNNDDFEIYVNFGNLAIDQPHTAGLKILTPGIEVCTESNTPWRPRYFNFGDSLHCTGGYSWNTDTTLLMGSDGGFTPLGPATVSNKYVAFRMTGSNIALWFEVTFDVTAYVTPWPSLEVHQVLDGCFILSVADEDWNNTLQLGPSPNHNGILQLYADRTIHTLEIFNISGQSVKQVAFPSTQVELPQEAGVYLVRLTDGDGNVASRKVVRW